MVGQGVVRPGVRDRLLAPQHLAHDVDVLARARERLAERPAVPALDHLRARDAEAEDQRPRERWSSVSACIAVEVGVRAEICTMPVPSRMRAVRAASQASGVKASRAPGLGGPDRVVAEALGLLRQLDGPWAAPRPSSRAGDRASSRTSRSHAPSLESRPMQERDAAPEPGQPRPQRPRAGGAPRRPAARLPAAAASRGAGLLAPSRRRMPQRRAARCAQGYWVVSKYADVVHVSRHPRLFSSAVGSHLIGDMAPRTSPACARS